MIISHHHQFIFAAVPKTGTHAVRQALREQMGEEDVEQVGLFVNKRFPWEDLAAIQHGHLPLRQVRPFLGDDAFGSYLKFAFVRNPFDRFISYCAFMLRGGDVFQQRPRDVMHHFLFTQPPEQHILFQTQASLLVDADGKTLLTDQVGRVEDMQASYDAICARIGIPFRPLDRVNSSRHGDYRRYYDQTLIDGVTARYAQDLELFGYSFEGRAMSGAVHIPVANPRKTMTVHRLGPIDIAALRAGVLAIPEDIWSTENARKPNRFGVLDETQHIVFRFIDNPIDWRRSYDCPAWPRWRDILEPVLAQTVRSYGYARGVFPRVMLARLPSGGMIHPHIDANPAAKWPHKIHIPLTTNDRVLSCFGGGEHHFPQSEAVEVNNLGPHWVRNDGGTDRVHLIFEYYDADQPNPVWLEPLLRAGAAW